MDTLLSYKEDIYNCTSTSTDRVEVLGIDKPFM